MLTHRPDITEIILEKDFKPQNHPTMERGYPTKKRGFACLDTIYLFFRYFSKSFLNFGRRVKDDVSSVFLHFYTYICLDLKDTTERHDLPYQK